MQVSEVISKVRILIGDHNNELFSDEEIMNELSYVIAELTQDLDCYVRDGSIQIEEDAEQFDYPEDMLSVISTHVDDKTIGRMLLNSTYGQISASGYGTGVQSQYSPANWGYGGNQNLTASGRVILRDNASWNAFKVVPPFKADEDIIYNGETYSHAKEA